MGPPPRLDVWECGGGGTFREGRGRYGPHISAWTVSARAHDTVRGDPIPNGTTQRAFLLGSWLGPWPPGIRPRRSGQITHWAIIAPSTRDALGALARELGLAARCSSASWTRPYEWSLVSREGLRRARSCREGPQCVTRPLRVRHYSILRWIRKHGRKRRLARIQTGSTSPGTIVGI